MARENAYLRHLETQGVVIENLADADNDGTAIQKTRLAMEKGVDAIAQATLAEGRWFGRADILRRVNIPSRLGSWSYEVYDCKLASETKAGTILQLSLYSELVAAIQGVAPERMYVVPPSETFETEPYRLLDFASYYRYVKERLENAVVLAEGDSTYPEPVPHCAVCRWFMTCDAVRRRDDHLSLVAGINMLQRKQLITWETNTVGALAVLPIPLQRRPSQGSVESYVRVREQARLQVAGRVSRQPVYEILSMSDEHGFRMLPEPSLGDIFFDLESDPFVGKTGREYLFGFVLRTANSEAAYESRWGLSPDDEKKAFEWFVDSVMGRWAEHPDMHIYHFTAYEPSAIKRLMGRYATREDEIDRMLRAGLFVDVHTVLKRSLRASVEQYSLKTMEPFHDFERRVPLDQARTAMRQMEHGLELGQESGVDEVVRQTIAGYNADDCLSTLSLRDWLEHERTLLIAEGILIPRPEASDGAPPASVSERQKRTNDLVAELTRDIPVDPRLHTLEQQARKLLADLLEWHRRENKVAWWEFFRLKDMPDEDLLDEKAAVSGLRFVERLSEIRKIPTDRYAFDKQETEVRRGDTVCAKGDKIGEVVAIDVAARIIDIRKMKKTSDIHPGSVFVDGRGPKNDVMADALFRIGTWVAEHGMDAQGEYRAARDLLLRRPPRLAADGALLLPGESTLNAAKRIALSLDNSVLAIQGPPGAGKTYTGARMILELVLRGKKVGITATSHKVIGNLLEAVVKAAGENGITGLKCLQKVTEEPEEEPTGITITTDNKNARAALEGGVQILGGTSWLWSSEDFSGAVDVLFVDEAGQMALANVLAVSQAAKSIVLLGDPQQLEQPQQGSHPEGAEASALEHILDGAKTIPPEKGLFLEKTWRLHPAICEFTSSVFYESRLQSRDGLEWQRIDGHAWLGSAGLWFVPVAHEGNRNASSEEVERIAGIIDGLLQPGVTYADGTNPPQPLRLEDILVVAPYNAQVSDLADRLPGARIGTVDKFQGQEAPVVIYSLASSSPEEAPRGMEFLYSLNRLNVATSRAQAMVILVGSPRLLEPECRTPRQMQLANALCRFRELAQSPGSARQAVGSVENQLLQSRPTR
jgi:predicted RecB family nuclease